MAVKSRITFYFCLFWALSANTMKGQTSSNSISFYHIEIINFSTKFYYNTNGSYDYASSGFSYQNALETMQARYDYYHGLVSNEYFKLKDFSVINQGNQRILEDYKNQRLNWVYNAGSNWDLGVPDNAISILNYCTEIYSFSTIKEEILLLKQVNREIKRLKAQYPNDFYNTQRYADLSAAIKELYNCAPSEISNLSWRYGLGGQPAVSAPAKTDEFNIKRGETLLSQSTLTIKDLSDNTYNVTIVGNQKWLSENLRAKKFRDGSPIKQSKTIKEWDYFNSKSIPTWAYFDFDPKNEKRGLIYNFYAVDDKRGIAPAGTHVASIEDWNLLFSQFKDQYAAISALEKSKWQMVNCQMFSTCKGIKSNFQSGYGGGYSWTSTINNQGAFYAHIFVGGGIYDLKEYNTYCKDYCGGFPVKLILDKP
jgi:uncharacterized protein (TIGR02145 family)